MKTIFITFCLATLLCGCSQKAEPDPRIIEIQRRFIGLENRLSVIEDTLTNQAAINAGTLATLNIANEYMAEQSNLNLALSIQIAEHIGDSNSHSAKTTGRYQPLSPSLIKPKPAAMSNGVPAAIYKQIAANAARKWGSDFEMQEYEIKNQIKAYQKLNP